MKKLTPLEFAEDWYSTERVKEWLARMEVPEPRTDEFVEWMTSHFQAAMTKGIVMGQSDKSIIGRCPNCGQACDCE